VLPSDSYSPLALCLGSSWHMRLTPAAILTPSAGRIHSQRRSRSCNPQDKCGGNANYRFRSGSLDTHNSSRKRHTEAIKPSLSISVRAGRAIGIIFNGCARFCYPPLPTPHVSIPEAGMHPGPQQQRRYDVCVCIQEQREHSTRACPELAHRISCSLTQLRHPGVYTSCQVVRSPETQRRSVCVACRWQQRMHEVKVRANPGWLGDTLEEAA
jgi:hypothetical protein